MEKGLTPKEQLEANQKDIRTFFSKWKELFNYSELSRRTGYDRQMIVSIFTSQPRKYSIAAYNRMNKDMMRELRDVFKALRADLDKVISDIDNYLR